MGEKLYKNDMKKKMHRILSGLLVMVMLCNVWGLPVRAEKGNEQSVEVYFVSFADSPEMKDTFDEYQEKMEQVLNEKYAENQIHYNTYEEEQQERFDYCLKGNQEEYKENSVQKIIEELLEEEHISERSTQGKLVLILNDGLKEKKHITEKVDGLDENWDASVEIFNYAYLDAEENKVTNDAEETSGEILSRISVSKSTVDIRTYEKVQLYYNVSKSVCGTIEVYNQTGEKVKTIYSDTQHKQGYYVVGWSGKDDEGKYVVPGTYRLKLTFEDDQKEIKITITDSLALTDVKLEKNEVERGEVVKIYYRLNGASNGDIAVYDKDNKKIRDIYSDISHNSGGYVAYWNGKDSSGNLVKAGEYTIRLKFRGQEQDLQVIVNEESILSDVKLTSQTMDVRIGQVAELYYRVGRACEGTIEAYNEEGKKVKTIYSKVNHRAGYYVVRWSGKDDEGKYVVPGTYRLKLTFEGDQKEIKITIADSLALTDVKLEKNEVERGEVVKIYYRLNGASNGDIAVYDKDNKKIRDIYSEISHNSGGYVAYWNGKDSSGNLVKAGEYIIRLKFRGQEQDLQVIVNEKSILSDVKLTSQTMDVRTGQVAELYYRVGRACEGTIEAYNEEGKKVKTIYSKVNHRAGYYVVRWSGKDDEGKYVVPGTYRLKLTFEGDQKEIKITIADSLALTDVKLEKNAVERGEVVKIYYRLNGASNGDIAVYDKDNKKIRDIYSEISHNSGGYVAYWNGKDSSGNLVKAGEYIIRLKFRGQEQDLQVIVNEKSILSDVKLEKDTVIKGELVKIYYRLSESEKGDITIYDKNDKKVRDIYVDVDHNSGYYVAYWNGKDNDGNVVSPGEYKIQLKFGLHKQILKVRIEKGNTISDMRAVWISYIELDQLLKGKTQAQFEQNIDKVISDVKNFNLNTIVVQVRSHGDAIYLSKVYPWSKYASGNVGVSPGFDPFAIIVNKAHANGIKIHAWVNPYRLMKDSDMEKVPEEFTIRKWYKNPTYMMKNADGYWCLNPGNSEVQMLINSGVEEIVNQYDVDGIHIDDYFYSSGITPETFGQTETEARNSTTRTVKGIYDTIKNIDSTVKFGVSPAGNFTGEIPNTDLEHYTDVKLWCSQPGYLDYVVPQIYWEQTHATAPFEKVLNKWENLLKESSVKLYIGLAAYKFSGTLELERQMEFIDDSVVSEGYILFRYGNLVSTGDTLKLTDISFKQDKVSLSRGKIAIYYRVNKECLGDIEIYDAYGNKISAIYSAVKHNTGYYQALWSMKDNSGNLVKPGVYTFKLKFRADGVVKTAESKINIRKNVVWIDAGHGGSDPGAVSNGHIERDDNLKIALEVQRVLKQQGMEVLMSRVDSDPGYSSAGLVSLKKRLETANAQGADVFVSLHRDSASPGANGYTVYTHNADDSANYNANAYPNKNSGCKALSSSINAMLTNTGTLRSRGVKYGSAGGTDDLLVNKNSDMPSCLIEMGFITNASDNQKFDTYLKVNAKAIAKGIMSYLGVQFNESKYTY